MLTPDVLIFAAAFYGKFGYDRPLYTLGHDGLFPGPVADWLRRLGVNPRQRVECRQCAGGRADSCWLSPVESTTRTGRPWPATSSTSMAAPDMSGPRIEAGVPIVPAVSIGGQESQLFLTRGTWAGQTAGSVSVPVGCPAITLGFPFGLSVIMPPNLPLPTKIVTDVLEPIDLACAVR